jgi:Flp pilus assembly pilin Flp
MTLAVSAEPVAKTLCLWEMGGLFCTFHDSPSNGPRVLADRNGMKEERAIQVRRGFWAEETGPTVTEYAVLLFLIVFGVFASIALVGVFIKRSFTTLSSSIPGS